MKNNYDKYLKGEVSEAYTLLGQYYANFNFLDKEWAKEYVKKVEESDNKLIFESFVGGYIFRTPYLDLYQLMKNLYIKCIGHEFKDKQSEEQFIRHVCIYYLEITEEDLTNKSLSGLVLKNYKPSHILKAINYFWRQSKYTLKPSQIRKMKADMPNKEIPGRVKYCWQKVMKFWKHLYKIYKDKKEDELSDDDKKIISDTAKFIAYLEEIDEEKFLWLMLAAKYVEYNYNSANFISNLNDLKDTGEDKTRTAYYIADIFWEMLNSESMQYPVEFDPKNIKSIVKYLYTIDNEDVKQKADSICNYYVSKGSRLAPDLRKLYEANQ